MSSIPVVFLLIILYVTIQTSVTQFADVCATNSGKIGKCVRVEQCPTAIELITLRQHPKLCDYDKTHPIVCCDIVKDNSSKFKREIAARIAEQKCLEYITKATPTTTTTAPGNTIIQLKVPAVPLEFPHMAKLGYGNEGAILWRCGGTIISEKFILTTVLCTHSEFGKVTDVDVGGHQSGLIKFYAQRFKVKSIYQHPDFKPPQKYNDIGLIEIDGQIILTPLGIRPACLEIEERIEGDYFMGIGWGRRYGENSSNLLQSIDLTITSFDKCAKEYKPQKGLEKGIMDDIQMCASSFEKRPDTCQEDTGGPLQIKLKGTNLYKIVGVRSFGLVCDIIPAIYSRVSYYVPWIENIVWPA